MADIRFQLIYPERRRGIGSIVRWLVHALGIAHFVVAIALSKLLVNVCSSYFLLSLDIINIHVSTLVIASIFA